VRWSARYLGQLDTEKLAPWDIGRQFSKASQQRAILEHTASDGGSRLRAKNATQLSVVDRRNQDAKRWRKRADGKR
jgi:hypothetical protein